MSMLISILGQAQAYQPRAFGFHSAASLIAMSICAVAGFLHPHRYISFRMRQKVVGRFDYVFAVFSV